MWIVIVSVVSVCVVLSIVVLLILLRKRHLSRKSRTQANDISYTVLKEFSLPQLSHDAASHMTELCGGLIKTVEVHEQSPNLKMSRLSSNYLPEELFVTTTPSVDNKSSASSSKNYKAESRFSSSTPNSSQSPSTLDDSLSLVDSVFSNDQQLQPCSPTADNKGPEMLFSLLYDEQNSSLTVTIICIIKMLQKYESHKIYVKTYLRPHDAQQQVSQTRLGAQPEFRECFYFEKVLKEDLAKKHLLFTVHKHPGDRIIAELFVQLSKHRWDPGVMSHCRQPLVTRPRVRRRSTADKLMSNYLGQLMVLLNYQKETGRLKVIIHKACHLIKAEKLPIKSDYYVLVSLHSCVSGELVESKSTATVQGENPTWNEVFLFYLGTSSLYDSYIELTVMERRFYKSSDSVIGHVVFDKKNASAEATKQWLDCSAPRALELAIWHPILPRVAYTED